MKYWVLTVSALRPIFPPHSCLPLEQWAGAPDKKSRKPPRQIPNFSPCLGILSSPFLRDLFLKWRDYIKDFFVA
jgi:hypothetical protein